jgi:hypothetical protein
MDNNQVATLKHDTIVLQKFIAKYIELGNATKAYLSLHPTCSYDAARSLGSRMLAKVNITELMEEMGITDRALLQSVAIGIAKPVRKVVKKEIKHKFIDRDETEIEYEDVPDYQTRHKFVETALKLKKKLGGDIDLDLDVTFVFGDSQATTQSQPQVPIIQGQTVDRT